MTSRAREEDKKLDLIDDFYMNEKEEIVLKLQSGKEVVVNLFDVLVDFKTLANNHALRERGVIK